MTAAHVLNLNRRYRTLNTSITIENGIDPVLSSRGEITLLKIILSHRRKSQCILPNAFPPS